MRLRLCDITICAVANFRFTPLLEALLALRRSPQLAPAVAQLRQQSEELLAELQHSVLAEAPAFTASQDPATLAQLALHGPQQLAEMLRLLEGGALDDLRFAADHARLRAEHRFPLQAVLHAYRCGHRVFAQALRRALVRTGSIVADAPDLPAAPAPRLPADPSPGAGLDLAIGAFAAAAEPAAAVAAAEPAAAAAAAEPAAAAASLQAALADFAMEYTDAISSVAAAAYAERSGELAEQAEQQGEQLLSLLLDGYDESDARVAALLRRAGYLEWRQTFCVVLAQSVDASEMASPSRARRLLEAIDQLLPPTLARRLTGLHDGRVVAVLSAMRRTSGWTAPGPSLAARVAIELATAGNAVLIGISADVSSTSRIPGAHRQALLALRMAGIGQRVVQFAATPLPRLMIHLAGEELQRLLPAWAASLYEADDLADGLLMRTLRAYADADMNVLKAAARLAVHPNTVYARLHRVTEITGLSARNYHALTDLITVAEARSGGAAQP